MWVARLKCGYSDLVKVGVLVTFGCFNWFCSLSPPKTKDSRPTLEGQRARPPLTAHNWRRFTEFAILMVCCLREIRKISTSCSLETTLPTFKIPWSAQDLGRVTRRKGRHNLDTLRCSRKGASLNMDPGYKSLKSLVLTVSSTTSPDTQCL